MEKQDTDELSNGDQEKNIGDEEKEVNLGEHQQEKNQQIDAENQDQNYQPNQQSDQANINQEGELKQQNHGQQQSIEVQDYPKIAQPYINDAIFQIKENNLEEALKIFQKAEQQLSGSELSSIYFQHGSLLSNSDSNQSLFLFYKSLQVNPNNAMAHYNLALTLLRVFSTGKIPSQISASQIQEKIQEALNHFEKSIECASEKQTPEQIAEFYLTYGKLIKGLQENNSEKAKALIQKAVELAPSHVLAHCQLADIYKEEGMFETAEFHYRSALSIAPYNPIFHEKYGDMLNQADRLSQALNQYNIGLQIFNDQLKQDLARYHEADGEGFEELPSFSSQTQRLSLQIKYSRLLTILMYYQDAIYHLNIALQIDPKNQNVLLLLSHVYNSLQNYSEAIKICKQAIQLEKEQIDKMVNKKVKSLPITHLQTHLNLAIAYFSLEMNKESENELEVIIGVLPKLEQIFRENNMLSGQNSKTLYHVWRVAYSNLATQKQSEGKLEEAEKLYLLAMEKVELCLSPLLISNICALYFKMDNQEKAVYYFQLIKKQFYEKYFIGSSHLEVLEKLHKIDRNISYANVVNIAQTVQSLGPAYDRYRQLDTLQTKTAFSGKSEEDEVTNIRKSMNQIFYENLSCKPNANQISTEAVSLSSQDMQIQAKITQRASISQEPTKREKQLQDKLNKLEKQMEEMIYKVNKDILFEEKFEELLENLEDEGKTKACSYGRNLCWILCTSIHSYREVKLGLVEKGNVSKTEVSGYVKKISKFLGKGTKVPYIGKVCSIISLIAGVYLNLEQEATIKKILASTQKYYSERLLSKAIIEMLIYILNQPEYIEEIQQKMKVSEKTQKKWYQQIMEKAQKKKSEIMFQINQIQEIPSDDQLAISDCSAILLSILLTSDISGNIFKNAATSVFTKKVEEEHKKEEEKKKEKQKNEEEKKKEQKNIVQQKMEPIKPKKEEIIKKQQEEQLVQEKQAQEEESQIFLASKNQPNNQEDDTLHQNEKFSIGKKCSIDCSLM